MPLFEEREQVADGCSSDCVSDHDICLLYASSFSTLIQLLLILSSRSGHHRNLSRFWTARSRLLATVSASTGDPEIPRQFDSIKSWSVSNRPTNILRHATHNVQLLRLSRMCIRPSLRQHHPQLCSISYGPDGIRSEVVEHSKRVCNLLPARCGQS